MYIPDTNPYKTMIEASMRIDQASQYEGKDMGGSHYRRFRKDAEEKKQEPEEKKHTCENGHIDLVA